MIKWHTTTLFSLSTLRTSASTLQLLPLPSAFSPISFFQRLLIERSLPSLASLLVWSGTKSTYPKRNLSAAKAKGGKGVSRLMTSPFDSVSFLFLFLFLRRPPSPSFLPSMPSLYPILLSIAIIGSLGVVYETCKYLLTRPVISLPPSPPPHLSLESFELS